MIPQVRFDFADSVFLSLMEYLLFSRSGTQIQNERLRLSVSRALSVALDDRRDEGRAYVQPCQISDRDDTVLS